MSRHYSTRDFFRQMPNALLARYFASRGVLQDFDFAAMKETKIEPLFEAWMALPGHHDRAMTAFLDYPKLWKGATRLSARAGWRGSAARRLSVSHPPRSADRTHAQRRMATLAV
jgi:hypothetical protein